MMHPDSPVLQLPTKAHDAWCQHTSNGTQCTDGKDYPGRVRAVRRFKLTP